MKTPYLESKRHKICKGIFWGLIVILIFLLFGCIKQPDPVETAANAAHQQIVAIKETLPKECQTIAIEEQLKAHDATVETIVTNCKLKTEKITAEKIRWQWAFGALSIMVLAYIARKVLK